MKNMDKYVKEIITALNSVESVNVQNFLRAGSILTVYLITTKQVYENILVPILIQYGGVMQFWEEVDDGQYLGQEYRYTILFINR